jgi:hypothetical protein
MAEIAAAAYRDAAAAALPPSKPAVSWAAIIAGAFVAAAISLILLSLGSGLGFASASRAGGVSGMTLAVTAAIWLVITQWISAGIGGYIAGRMRTRWIGTHTHEVFFRDTAHGLITWAVATLLVVVTAGATGRTAVEVASISSQGNSGGGASYELDRLLRPSDMAAASSGPDARPEVARIMANATVGGTVSDGDRGYLSQLVTARTGVSQQEAERRVDDFVMMAMETRKAAAKASIYLALSLLVGAFIACVCAALGGWLRDEHP